MEIEYQNTENGHNVRAYLNTRTLQSKPPYWMVVFCIIPLVGAFVGLIILILGITKYKSKTFSIVGICGILFTVIVYSALYYETKHSPVVKQGFAELSQMQLNSLVKNIEFYKMEHGQYPDSLRLLLNDDKTAFIYDVIQVNQGRKATLYNYQKKDNHYSLSSSGEDGIPNTKDDLFPRINANDSNKIGFVK